MTITNEDVTWLNDWLMKNLEPIITGMTDKIVARFEALEKQSLSYRGVYKRGELYSPSDTVTCDGGLWIAERATTEKPGSGSDTGWCLAVKSGAAS